MTQKRTPRPPLSARAQAFGDHVADTYDLTDDEAELLTEVVTTLDEIDSLRAALEHDGITVAGSKGQARVHPAVNEIRQHRMSLARLLKALALPGDADERETLTTKNARAAANARWEMEREARHGKA